MPLSEAFSFLLHNDGSASFSWEFEFELPRKLKTHEKCMTDKRKIHALDNIIIMMMMMMMMTSYW